MWDKEVGTKDDFNLYAYVYNDPLNRSDPLGTETGAAFRSINCATAPSTCGSGIRPSTESSKQVSEIESSVQKGLEAVEKVADVTGKAIETATVPVASEGMVTPITKMVEHKMIGAAVKGLGKLNKAADLVEIGSEVAQGDFKGAAGSTLNIGIGTGAVFLAIAAGAAPPVAVGIGATAALGADLGDVGDRIVRAVTPAGTLTTQDIVMRSK